MTRTKDREAQITADTTEGIGQHSVNSRILEQTGLKTQLVEVDLMQSNVFEFGGKEVVETDMVSPLKAIYINEEIVDVHGLSDMTYDKSGDNNTFGLNNMSTHATSSTKQPTWTRKTRHQTYESTKKQGGQIQKVGEKREFEESEMTTGLEALKDGKRIK